MHFKVKGRGGQKKIVDLRGGELERICKGERTLSKREVLSFFIGAFNPGFRQHRKMRTSS